MSTLKADTIQNTSGGAATLTKQVAAKVYISLADDMATTHKSFNVSSVDDDGTADAGVNLTNNMSDSVYPAVLGVQTTLDTSGTNNVRVSYVNAKSASEIGLRTGYVNSSGMYVQQEVSIGSQDYELVAHGDLA